MGSELVPAGLLLAVLAMLLGGLPRIHAESLARLRQRRQEM
jgi:hypothetical protein